MTKHLFIIANQNIILFWYNLQTRTKFYCCAFAEKEIEDYGRLMGICIIFEFKRMLMRLPERRAIELTKS